MNKLFIDGLSFYSSLFPPEKSCFCPVPRQRSAHVCLPMSLCRCRTMGLCMSAYQCRCVSAELWVCACLLTNVAMSLQNYGEHGRELITVEVALRLLAALADPGPAIERSVQRGHSPHLLKNLLHSSVFKARRRK